MTSRLVTRSLALLFLFVFIFSIWSYRQSWNISQAVDRDIAVHGQGYKNSWVIKIDSISKSVRVQTVEGKEETRIDIVFQVDDEFLYFLQNNSHENWLLPVTLLCGKKAGEECDLNEPYVLYVATRRVKPLRVQKVVPNG